MLGLTAAGRRLDVVAPGTIEAVMRDVLEKLPRRKLDATREVLAAIAGALGEESQNVMRSHEPAPPASPTRATGTPSTPRCSSPP